jgi:hypothetical protein
MSCVACRSSEAVSAAVGLRQRRATIAQNWKVDRTGWAMLTLIARSVAALNHPLTMVRFAAREEEPMPNQAHDDVIDPTEIASRIAAGEPVMNRMIRVNGRIIRFSESTGKDLMAIADECRRRSAELSLSGRAQLNWNDWRRR